MPDPRSEIGARLRSARQLRQLSLSDVASRAGISVATLSRLETSKQSVDVELLTTLAGILGIAPARLLGPGEDSQDLELLADRLAALRAAERAEIMRAAARRRQKQKDLGAVVDDLLATLDILRDELEQVARATRKRRRR